MADGILSSLTEGYRGRVKRRDASVRENIRKDIVAREEAEAKRLLKDSQAAFSEGDYESATELSYEGYIRQVAAARFATESFLGR